MRRCFCLLLCCTFLFSTNVMAASENAKDVPLDKAQKTYAELMNMRGTSSIRISKEMAELRPKALREQAERLGVQSAFRAYYTSYEAELEKRARDLDRIFDFAPLLLHKGSVRPPVLTQAGESAELNGSSMTRTGMSYHILKPALFVSVEPSWRDYLVLPESSKTVEEVHPAMLPLGSEERRIWQEGIRTGWEQGKTFAERMFRRNLNELERDYAGLILYKRLSLKGYISTPIIAERHIGVQVGDTILEFDQQEFRITEPAKFQQRDKWR